MDLLRKLAASYDIDTTAGHVCSDGYGTKSASTGNNLAFFGVFAGVEHLMDYTCLQALIQTVDIPLLQT